MSRRSFVVFDSSDCAAADCLRLLGRVVLDPRRPLDNYRPRIKQRDTTSTENISLDPSSEEALRSQDSDGKPDEKIVPSNRIVSDKQREQPNRPSNEDSDPFLSEFRLKAVIDEKTTIKAEVVKSTKAHASLTKLFSASRDASKSSWRTMKATSMQTFALEQYQDVYDELIKDYNTDLEELMQRQEVGQPLYMMVTLKTAEGLKVVNSNEEHREVAMKGKVPVAELANLGGAPPGAGTKILGTVEAGVKQTKTRKEALRLVAADERGIAAEYCEIERTPTIKFRLRLKKNADKPKLKFKNQISRFSGEHLSFSGEDKDQASMVGAENEEEIVDEYI